MTDQSIINANNRNKHIAIPHGDPFLNWLIFSGICLFVFFVLLYFGFAQKMVASDPTHISSVIVFLYGGTTLHCLWRSVAISREGRAALSTARFVTNDEYGPLMTGDIAQSSLKGLIAAHIRDLSAKARLQGARRLDQTLLLRVLAGKLRGSNQLGTFASDTLMKLGLLGTIVGFIMMLGPIAGLDAENQGAVKSSMALMSEGMAVAMYTTLVGLAGSILVKIQYYMLEDATAKLFAFAVGLTEVHVISILEARMDRSE